METRKIVHCTFENLEIVEAWKKPNPSVDEVLVTEMFSVLTGR